MKYLVEIPAKLLSDPVYLITIEVVLTLRLTVLAELRTKLDEVLKFVSVITSANKVVDYDSTQGWSPSSLALWTLEGDLHCVAEVFVALVVISSDTLSHGGIKSYQHDVDSIFEVLRPIYQLKSAHFKL